MSILSVLLSFIAMTETGITGQVWNFDNYDVQAYDLVIKEPSGLRVIYDGATYNEFSFRIFLPAGTGLVLRCDPGTLNLADTLAPDYGLTGDAEAAVEVAPAWLRFDLIDNFMYLTEAKQDALADIILNPPDTRLRDEIAFQVAHVSPNHLLTMDPNVLISNVDSLYAIDEELGYVDIVDYGNPETDDDYYSTVRYKALEDDSPVEFEIPRDIYYWYIVHPRGTDETPKIIYGKFWREFLYYDDGTASYTENPDGDPYPLLKDVLADITYLWDGKRYVWASDRELSPDMCALDAVGWWVSRVLPRSATSPRPIQPSEIATDHDGNCGETQDLYWAGLRTGLIPALGVMDINEDHVWNAFWYPLDPENPEAGGWYPCQVDLGGGVTHAADSGCAYDKDRGSSKYCSLIWDWRGDGYQSSSIGTYSNCCTLTVIVYDASGNPVPNADVKLSSEGWQTGMVWAGYAGLTDRSGSYTTTLGEEQNYYLAVYLDGFGQILDSVSTLAGSHFVFPCTLSTNYKPQPRELDFEKYVNFPIHGELDTTITLPADGICYPTFFNNYAEMGEVISGTVSFQGSDLHLNVKAEYDLGHCPTYVISEASKGQGLYKFEPGVLTDFFITDYDGIYALTVTETRPSPPEPVSVEVLSSLQGAGSVFKISGCSKPVKVDVFDILGRRVYSTAAAPDASGIILVEWQGLDNLGLSQSSGVYFVRVKSGNQTAAAKFVMLR